MEDIYNKFTEEFDIAKSELGLKGTSVIAGLFNLFLCFFGYRYHRFLIALAGFMVGADAAYKTVSGVTMDNAMKILIILIAGLVCSLIAYSFYKLGIVVLVFAATYTFVMQLIGTNVAEPYNMYIAIVAGLLVGFVALRMIRPIVIVMTGLAGGTTAVTTFATLIGYSNGTFLTIVGLVLAALGIMYQFKNTIEQ
jgi:hypothetical protein